MDTAPANALSASSLTSLGDVEAVLLDMDGTLVDSDAAVERSWRQWCAITGGPLETVLRIHTGKPAARTIRELFPDWSEAQVAESAELQLGLQYDDLHDVVAAVGAAELLKRLRNQGLPWAIVTSADLRLATARLAAADITASEVTGAGIEAPLLVTTDDISRGKPDPEGYLLAAAKLGVAPERCLVVEDAPAGVAAGAAAGMRVAGLRGVGGDLPIADLMELAQLLAAALRERR